MKLSRLAAVTTGVVVAFSGLSAGPALAAKPKPGVVVDYQYHTIKVKPKTIEPFKDLYFTKVRWTKLTNSTGRATAVQNFNTCLPSCAEGNYKRTKVTMKFTRVRSSDCRKVFTRVRVTEVKSHRAKTYRLPSHRSTNCG
jgi:type 1 fimbria pilin